MIARILPGFGDWIWLEWLCYLLLVWCKVCVTVRSDPCAREPKENHNRVCACVCVIAGETSIPLSLTRLTASLPGSLLGGGVFSVAASASNLGVESSP